MSGRLKGGVEGGRPDVERMFLGEDGKPFIGLGARDHVGAGCFVGQMLGRMPRIARKAKPMHRVICNGIGHLTSNSGALGSSESTEIYLIFAENTNVHGLFPTISSTKLLALAKIYEALCLQAAAVSRFRMGQADDPPEERPPRSRKDVRQPS